MLKIYQIQPNVNRMRKSFLAFNHLEIIAKKLWKVRKTTDFVADLINVMKNEEDSEQLRDELNDW